MFGFDHRDAGRHLITEWQLPQELEAMLQCDCDLQEGDWYQLPHLVHLGCQLADAAGFAAFAGCEVTPYAELMEAMPVRVRSLFPADEKRLAFDIGSKIHAIESY